MPAYTAKDVKIAADMEKRLGQIEKLVKSSSKHWGKMGEARSLEKAHKSMAAFEKQQKGFEKAMKAGNISMASRVQQYDKLAKARKQAIEDIKEHNKELNEQKGVLGRTQNVLNDLAEHKGMALFGAAIKDASLILGDMNTQFDILARTGQAGEMSFGQLAGATASYSKEMRFAMLGAAKFGVEAKDSNAAFAQLTETYGGTGATIDMLGDRWEGMAQLARMSGLGMVDVAKMADQGFKRLGESVDTTMNNVVAMTEATTELNKRYGEGSVNSREFANAVNTLAYSSGFYNQNTRMVIESLSREINMQLALGRSREAAVVSAQKNLEMAGKVNIVGITKFREDMNEAYKAAVAKGEGHKYLNEIIEKFGSEGELIAHMMRKGTLMSSGNLFAMRDLVKSSSALQSEMMESFRVSALAGPGQLLARGVGLDDAMRMVAESRMIADKLAVIGAGGDPSEVFKDAEQEKSPETQALIAKLRDKDKPMTRAEMVREFYKMGGAGDIAEDLKKETGAGESKQQPWEKYVGKTKGAGWFAGITNSFKVIAGLLGQLPVAFAVTVGALMARQGLGRALGNIGLPGRGAGAISRGGRMARMGGAARGMAGGAAAGAAAGLVIYGMVDAFTEALDKSVELFGKDPGLKNTLGVWSGKMLEKLSLGMMSFTDEELKGLATGALESRITWFGDKLGDAYMAGVDWAIKGGEMLKDFSAKVEETSGVSVPEHERNTMQNLYAWFTQHQRGAGWQAPGTETVTPGSATVAETTGTVAGDVTARGTGHTSGRSLILEVENWEPLLAEGQMAVAGNS
jgi:hypothetical protein